MIIRMHLNGRWLSCLMYNIELLQMDDFLGNQGVGWNSCLFVLSLYIAHLLMLRVTWEWWYQRIIHSRWCYQNKLNAGYYIGVSRIGVIWEKWFLCWCSVEGYGKCWGHFEILCWCFCNFFVMYPACRYPHIVYCGLCCSSILMLYHSINLLSSLWRFHSFLRAAIILSAFVLMTYFKPKSSTTRE